MLNKVWKQLPELVILASASVVGLLFFTLTNPKSLPPAALMFGFVILLVGTYAALRLTSRLSGIDSKLDRFRYYVLLIGTTLLVVMLVALQSIGQLDFRSSVTLAILFGSGYFYISRTHRRN